MDDAYWLMGEITLIRELGSGLACCAAAGVALPLPEEDLTTKGV